jgi:pilus assembly protein FimV
MMNKTIQRAACAAIFLLAGSAQALTIGDIDVKSSLGESFNAAIPVTLAPGEDLSSSCVRLENSDASKFKSIPVLLGYNMKVERNGNNVLVRLSTLQGVSEPVVRIGLTIRCGAKVSTSREFIITQKLADTPKK